ncbi:MAG: XTP/dITP diphosphatase [Caldisphaera sp.]|nr:XTP/dITP diphosphatase [Caldisphaera sp.]
MKLEKNLFGNEVCIVTRNKGKINEINELLKDYENYINLVTCDVEKIEIQDDDIRKISLFAALNAYNKIKRPVIVDDSGLFIYSLNGFPGPYSSFVYKTIGNDGILKLMEGIENREAYFKTSLAYVDSKTKKVFCGLVKGTISLHQRGNNGFGFDPLFIPQGVKLTFAEMDVINKNKYSHRAKAVKDFLNWFIKYKNNT